MQHRSYVRPLPALLLVLALAACQSGSSTRSEAPTSPSLAAETATLLPLALPRPTDIPTDGTCEEEHVCLGVLTAGSTYETQGFQPKITLTMPVDGWENLADELAVFQLLPISAPGDAIAFFRGAEGVEADGTTASVDQTVTGLSDWVASNDLLAVTAATPITVGGLSGVTMDITIAPGAVSHPSDCPVQTCVHIFKGEDMTARPVWHWDWGSADGEIQRLYLLTASDGVVAIFVDSFDGTTFEALTTGADKILAALTFG
jgi:hypothetical protein